MSSTLLGNAESLKLETTVNGELRQQARLDDVVFGVEHLVEYLSTGTTLQKGSVIMTGSPGGKSTS